MALIGGTWSYMAQVPWFPYQLRSRPGTMPFVGQAPQGAFVLNDGSVAFDCGFAWFRLVPDRQGNYSTGTFTRMSAKPWVSQYYNAASLADGRLLCWFGEFGVESSSNALNKPCIYDPAVDAWSYTSITNMPGTGNGDQAGSILPDGRVLIGPTTGTPKVYDPVADTWTSTGASNYPMLESGLCLRQDGTVLHYQGGYQVDGNIATHGFGEIYDPIANTWTVTAFPVDVEAIYDNVIVKALDMGPLVLMANGDCIQFGNAATGATAVYSAAGSWSSGPTMPTLSGQTKPAAVMDFPVVLMANGNLLIVGGQYANGSSWAGPNQTIESDGTLIGALVNQPTTQGSYPDLMLPLPNGQVLLGGPDMTGLEFFTPTSITPPTGKFPVITDVVNGAGATITTLPASTTLTVRGTRLNGCVGGRGNKDEHSCNQNFPIAVLKYGDGTVVYCVTKNTRKQSNGTPYMGVDPAASTKTDFVIPANAPNGSATLYVTTAGGMLSAGVAVTISGGGATYNAPLAVSAGVGEFYASTFSMYDGTLTKWYGPMPTSPTTHPTATPPSVWKNPSFVASGGTGPYTYVLDSHQALPTGVTLSSDSSGAGLVGTPTQAPIPAAVVSSGFYTVTYTFITVTATDSLGATGQGHFPMLVVDHVPVAFLTDNLTEHDALLWTGPSIGLAQTETLTDNASRIAAYKRHAGGNRYGRIH